VPWQDNDLDTYKRQKMKNNNVLRFFLASFFLIWVNLCFGQERWVLANIDEIRGVEDSICQFGKKYDYPKRLFIDYLAVKVDDEYKIQAINRAMPQPFEEDTSDENLNELAFYDIFFGGLILEGYDTMNYGLPSFEEFDNYEEFEEYYRNFPYTLRDFYFFDVNGDNKLDFIQYPLFHNVMQTDSHWYILFLQTENGYKQLHFQGFIVDINFNDDGTLNEIKTFQPRCCDNNFTFFYYYTFDKEKNKLTLLKEEKILTCQFNGKRPFSEF